MSKKQFNLVADPWINVIETKTDSLKTVSLIECFNNAHQYRQLAGDMRAQDLAIMRFLLAILHTVYSRFDMNGEPYEWVNIDSETFHVNTPVDEDDFDVEDLFQTWGNLYKSGKFSKIITQYLDKNQSRFNLFGDQAFYQVTEEEYDSFVPKKKYVATGTGTVAVKQLNRQISESGNTPAIFTPKSDTFKNRLSLSELTRWLITYQNFTGVTDKTKVQTEEKFSNPAGWVYRLNPVFAKGKSLFETLMLNLVLADEEHYQAQKPVWEYKSVTAYVEERKKRNSAR
ncbi:type I-E CRISPR-associated protein Cse1/CasA [Secundilactobacillus silagei]|uniref:type I-E CRISPR-associated protein Cse1/CasA n=1 Tax=Secundilactobacillus silagei TaxID=1293415 RepID=UPI000A5C19CB